MGQLNELEAERFWPTPPAVGNLTQRRAELADIQYRDPYIVQAYVNRLGGRICDLPTPLLDIIATILKEPA